MNPYTTLINNSTTINLPPDLLFENQSQYSNPFIQKQLMSLDGTVDIEEWTLITGRKIVLSGSDNRSWIDKSTLDSLLAFSVQAGLPLTLTLADTRQFVVMFDRTDEKPIDYKEIWEVSPFDTTSLFSIKLKFITIA